MHSLLENYLAHVERSLRLLPKNRRAEELKEIRQHLQNAVTLYQEQGQPEYEAAQSAIAQFGSPDDLGESIAQTWRRGQILRRRDIAKSAVSTVFLSLLVPRLLFLLTKPFFLQAINAHEFLLLPLLFGLPYLLVGMINGLALPQSALTGTGLGVGVRVIYWLIVTPFVDWPDAPGAHSSSSFLFLGGVLLTVCNLLIHWGPALCAAILGAWVGSRGRGRQARLTVR